MTVDDGTEIVAVVAPTPDADVETPVTLVSTWTLWCWPTDWPSSRRVGYIAVVELKLITSDHIR